ncbi:hypothetical protein [Aliamphritea spongicola]|nr:hypothetical protein [Aliamphritea spongicola]
MIAVFTGPNAFKFIISFSAFYLTVFTATFTEYTTSVSLSEQRTTNIINSILSTNEDKLIFSLEEINLDHFLNIREPNLFTPTEWRKTSKENAEKVVKSLSYTLGKERQTQLNIRQLYIRNKKSRILSDLHISSINLNDATIISLDTIISHSTINKLTIRSKYNLKIFLNDTSLNNTSIFTSDPDDHTFIRVSNSKLSGETRLGNVRGGSFIKNSTIDSLNIKILTLAA